jgi:hypothetical protein
MQAFRATQSIGIDMDPFGLRECRGKGKAANPFHSLAALQKLAHHASFWSAPAVAFPTPFNHTRSDRAQLQPSLCETSSLDSQASPTWFSPKAYLSEDRHEISNVKRD